MSDSSSLDIEDLEKLFSDKLLADNPIVKTARAAYGDFNEVRDLFVRGGILNALKSDALARSYISRARESFIGGIEACDLWLRQIQLRDIARQNADAINSRIDETVSWIEEEKK